MLDEPLGGRVSHGSPAPPFDAFPEDFIKRFGKSLRRNQGLGAALHLYQAIAGAKLGGAGPGVDPKTALAVGLKVDRDALPPELVENSNRRKSISGIPRQRRCCSS
jgi:hypothetical protein